MALTIEIDGTQYIYFTAATVTTSLSTIARGFSFVSTAGEDNNFPIKVGANVKIFIDGIQVLFGYAERIGIRYDATSHEINVDGRSYLSDLVDSTLPTQFEVTGKTFEDIATTVLGQMNLSSKVVNNAGTIRNFGDDITSTKIGQNALEFLERFARKRQILLTSAGDDSLVFARSGTTYAPVSLKNVLGATDNNILSADLTIDHSQRYYKYTAESQLNPLIPGLNLSPEGISNQSGTVYDDKIRASRFLTFDTEESSDSFTAYDRALWEKNVRRGTAKNYSATVAGNSVDGKIWEPNTLVRVIDELCQIDATLLIRDVEFNYDLFSGSTTTLTMVQKDAFTLQLEQSEREANAEKDGEEFVI